MDAGTARWRTTSCRCRDGEAQARHLDSYTKEHSAEYQSQALIDLAFRMREKITDFDDVEKILISHQPSHPQRDRRCQRSTKDGPEGKSAKRWTIRLCTSSRSPHKGWPAGITWTATHRSVRACRHRRYGTKSKQQRVLSGRAATVRPIQMSCPSAAEWRSSCRRHEAGDEMAVANAHPLGARPFGRDDYIRKFQIVTDGLSPHGKQTAFSKPSQDCRACQLASCTLNVACLPAH